MGPIAEEWVLVLSDSQLRDLDVRAATEKELSQPKQLTPSRTLESALVGHLDEVAEYLEGRYRNGLEVAGAETFFANKAGKGYRPLSVLSLEERVLYQCFTDQLTAGLVPYDRSFEAWQKFNESPLQMPSARYVVEADVAGFYDFIDHELLETELVAQTGKGATGALLTEFLHGVMQRRFGLPQTSFASDLLSEQVIDIAERRMLRRGYHDMRRFNDDFLFGVSDWRDVDPAIEALSSEIRAMGLALNDQKTRVVGKARYVEWVEAPETAWDSIRDEVHFDFVDFDPYTGEPLTSEEDEDKGDDEEASDEEIVEAASRALDYWEDKVGSEGVPSRVLRRLLSKALDSLGFRGSDEGIPHLWNILKRERHYAPAVGRYLTRLSSSEPSAVVDLLDGWGPRGGVYLSSWQTMWLVGSLLPTVDLTDGLGAWLKSLTAATHPSLLRARAALVLSWHDAIEEALLGQLYQELPAAARHDVVAAASLALPGSNPVLRSIVADGPINRWIAEASPT